MKKCFLAGLLIVELGLISPRMSVAQIFTGTNAPGQGTNFAFTVGASATNLSVAILNNSSAYSYLLLKKGGDPTDTDFDYAARLNGQNNTINLELPELVATNYRLRVLTPTNSTRHPFAVVLTPNLNGFRTASYPALKPVVFSVPGTLGMSPTGTWNYFQVDVPTNLPGWRIVLSSTNGGTPSLYVRQATLPLSTAYDKVGVVQNLSTVVYSATEALAGTYFIGVYLPPSAQSNAVYQLGTEVTGMPDLAWDPGQTHEGTLFYTNTSLTGGNYFFRALPQTTTVGAWRLALMVFDGEANLYLRQGTFDPSPANYTTFRSERVGSDGFVVPASQFAVGQTWYVCVVTSPGAHWTLLSGEAYVLKLGTLAPPGSTASSTNVQMGPEGMRFFQTATTPDTLAWRLGLRGATNALLVKSAAVPLPLNAATYDVQQNGQMLLVPSYLVPGNAYYIGVAGAPGDSVNLDSRQQAIVDVPFLSTNSLVVSDYGYVTYRISVPVQQMAWALSVSPSLGDANLCVRRDYVANEWNNDAFSEVPGATTDSLSLVPPTLSDGTFFVTVYGGTNSLCNYSGSFVSGNPSISPVAYVSTTVNDDPARVGWRYYQVSDIQAQLGSLGWELFLQNQPPGTEIALRRNAVPSRWNYRQNNGATAFSKGYVDYSSVQGFLQRPAHQADIWYVGVYNPSNVMGSFILNLQEIPRNPIAFDGAGAWTNVTVQTPGRFSYFRVEVPVGASGWDVRLTNVTSGTPRLVVRRDQLPDSLLTTSGWIPNSSSNWLGGNQWAAADDWTDLLRDPAGVSVDGRILACGLGNPLAPGTYYVGILNATADPAPMSYTLSSRGIGAGYSIPVNLLDYTNGSATISNLPLREVAYFQVTIGTNCDSWKMHLATNSGEALLLVQKDALPNVAAAQSSPLTLNGGRMVQKAGDEEYVLFPAGTNASLPPGTYYLAVVSEGQNPDRNQSRVGVGAIQALLTSQGSVAPQGLGTLAGMDLGAGGAWRAGEVQAYRFTVAPGVVAFELWLDSRVGNPRMTLQTNALYPTPLDRYGNDGGVVPAWSNDRLIQVANPVAGDYTLLVDAAMYNGVYTNASGTLRVHPLTAPPIAFDGGLFSANGIHPALSWRYFSITVPSNAVGWDVRLTNVTSGDPRMVVRRDLVPDTLLSSGAPWAQKQWPSGAQWAAGLDWTGYPYDPDGTNQNGHILQMGMGNPLEPGNYIVGVSSGTSYGYGTNEMRYTLVSRGIGPGLSLPVTDLTFTNGLMVLTNLPAREVAYFSVVVPTNVTSWALRLGTNAGDGLLCVQKDALPNVGAAATPPQTLSGGRKVQKVANEQYTLLTANGQTNFPSGTYYLAVISEGWNPGVPNASRIGTNIASLTCQSLGAMPRTDLGTIQSDASVSYPDVLEGGATKEYQFTVAPGTMSLEVRLDQRIGNPRMSLRADSLIPMPAGTYGCDGGQTRTWQQDSQIVIPNPTNGIYTLVVQADYTGPGGGSLSVYSNAAYTVMVRAAGSLPVPFDGGIVTVTGHPANTWKYYLVTNIAADALGWDVRLVNVTSGDPRLVIRRDQPPNSLQSSGSFWNLRQWPSNGQWAAALDWTGYVSDGDGTNQNGHILQMGMHNPLEPGVYYIGVFNGTAYGTGLNPMSYTLQCRGIGPGYSIPVAPLPFTNGVAGITNLPPREAAYFSVVVPTNMPSWQVRLGADVGDAMLCVQKDALPNVAAAGTAPQTLSGGRKLQKVGHEQYALLPANGQSNLVAGTYYLSVVSEGWNPGKPNVTWIGTNLTTATLRSIGAVPVTDLGWIQPGSDLLVTNALEGGALQLYRFMAAPGSLSTEVWMTNRVANPRMTVRADSQIPVLPGIYGNDGGQPSLAQQDSIVVPCPTNIQFTIAVQADFTSPGSGATAVYSNASYTLWLRCLAASPLVFDGGSLSVSDHMPGTWRYYLVQNLPAHALGWDVRLRNVLAGDPRLAVRRETQPDNLNTHASSGGGWSPQTSTNWPAGNQWAAAIDWTGCSYDLGGTSQVGRILQMGMGNPLEPGNYYIAVYNSSSTTIARYDIISRGIGDGYTVPVDELDYRGGRLADDILPSREAAYFYVDVPSNAPSWKVRLAVTTGDSVLAVQKDYLPNVLAATTPSVQIAGGYRVAKAGSEHYVLLPAPGLAFLPAGRYYILVASLGASPDLVNNRAGTGSSLYTITSQGPLPVEELGPLPVAGLMRNGSLEGGELGAYHFNLPAGLPGLVTRLDNRLGNPWFSLSRGDAVPVPYNIYGYNGGAASEWQQSQSLTLANAKSTNYTLLAQAAPVGTVFAKASYLLRIKPPPITALAFDPLLEDGSNTFATVCGQLADGERGFYRVVVPSVLPDGTPVIGWRLVLATSSGQAAVRVRKDLLPGDDYSGVGQTVFVNQQAVIVPPLLTNGTWYVEVSGTGATTFCLTSSGLRPMRPVWAMPGDGQPISTPGLTNGPLFGDTGVDPQGVSQPGDGGTDLEQGNLHYYAVNVPVKNGGVLRMMLAAINGNPDLYLRVGVPPTFTHREDGRTGAIYDRSLTGTATEYGNWVPINNRTEIVLRGGLYYIAVRASGTSNCRYRLRLSTGTITDLALNGSLSSQVMAAGDWRYYRFIIPTNAPLSWTITFQQQVGAVSMYVRDTVPPGQGTTVGDLCEWSRDSRNHGPYPSIMGPGTYTFNIPPVRPGSVSYVGFRAASDATFSISSSTNASAINITNLLAFYGGFVTNVLPPYGAQQFRIDVPPDASRWKHVSVAPATVRFHLDQGSVPTATYSDHHVFTGNTISDQYLLTPNNWPWVPGQMYFLTVTNTAGTNLGFSYRLDGKNCSNDDSDGDGLPDCWEMLYWPSVASFGPLDDPDHDGNNNLTELLDGTDPTDPTSMLARLTITIQGPGSISPSPAQPTYPWGTPVTLTATPAPGNVFLGWSAPGIFNAANPLSVAMTTNRAIVAFFDTDYGSTGCVRADYQFQGDLLSSIGSPPPLAFVNSSQTFTNAVVDGVSRTVLRYPQGTGLSLQPATLVFPSNEYTIVILFQFDTVSGWRRLVDFKNGLTWNGLYVVNGTLHFYPSASGAEVCVTNNVWHQVVLTRESNGLARVYCDGVPRLNFDDTAGSQAILSAANTLRFFKDNGVEESGGAVARIRTFNTALTPAQVAALDRFSSGAGAAGPIVLSAPALDSQGRFRFTITGPAGAACRVETSTSLKGWSPLTNIADFPGSLDYTCPPNLLTNWRFFRVVVP